MNSISQLNSQKEQQQILNQEVISKNIEHKSNFIKVLDTQQILKYYQSVKDGTYKYQIKDPIARQSELKLINEKINRIEEALVKC